MTQYCVVEINFGKENLQEFIAKKREMFLVQYALGVKRDEIQKLEEIAQVLNIIAAENYYNHLVGRRTKVIGR